MGLFQTDDPHYAALFAEESALVDASELIAEAMAANGASKADLARALNVSRSEITERLKGNRNMTIRSLAATLHSLGARLDMRVHLPSKAEKPTLPTDLAIYRGWRTESQSSHVEHSQDALYQRKFSAR